MTKPSHQGLGPSTLTPVPPFPSRLVVRGRVSLRKTDMAGTDRMRVDGGEPPLVRAEGLVWSSLASRYPSQAGFRSLRFFARETLGVEGLESRWQMLGALKSWGFAVLPLLWRCRGRQEVLDFVASLEGAAADFEYPLEGGILAVNRRAPAQASASMNDVRLLFPRSGKKVILRRLFAAVSRTGSMLPVVALESEQGAERAPVPAVRDGWLGVQTGQVGLLSPGRVTPSLHLASPGQTWSEAALTQALELRCSTCSGASGLYCERARCPLQERAMLVHCVGPRGMALGKLEPRSMEVLFHQMEQQFGGASGTAQNVSFLARVLQLDAKSAEINGLSSEVSLRFSAVQANWLRSIPLFRALYLSGVPGVGERVARIIAQQVHSATHLLRLGPPSLGRLEGVDPEVVHRFAAWLGPPGQPSPGRRSFEELKGLGVHLLDAKESFPAPYFGLRVVVSGVFHGGPGPVVDRIERLGGTVQSRVSRSTDLVVLGRDADRARNEAVMYGVSVVENFLALDAAFPG